MELRYKNEFFEKLFTGKELPDVIFKRDFKKNYFLTDEFFISYSRNSDFEKLIGTLLELCGDDRIYISKLFKTVNLYYPEITIPKEYIHELEYALSTSFSVNGVMKTDSYSSSYENPTILYSKSLEWIIYYLYNDELVLFSTDLNVDNFESMYDKYLFDFNSGDYGMDNKFMSELRMNYKQA